MPKRRDTTGAIHNSGTRVGVGGSGGLTPAGAADIISDIAGRTMDIDVESRSRGMETVSVRFGSRNHAYVTSGSGHTYEVDDDENDPHCNCPDHRYRGGECRHINAVRNALGRIVRSQNEGTRRPGELISDILPNLDSNEETLRVITEEQASHEFVDDNYFISDVPDEEFNRLMQEAVNAPMTYEYNNVLNGSPSTFGVELEITEGNGRRIAEELKRLGLNGSGRVLHYHEEEPADNNKWKVTLDGSVSYEIVSPVLRDDPQTWRDLETVCNVIKRNGGQVSLRCGGHVHVGVETLDNAKHRWRRLKKLITGYERILYRLSSGEFNQVRPSAYNQYAVPISSRLANVRDRDINIEDDSGREGIEGVARTMVVTGSRYQSVNFANLTRRGRPPTVEFRTFNGSITPGQIQQNIRVAVGIMDAAKNAQVQNERTRRRGELLKDTSYNSNMPTEGDHSLVRKFLDIVFPRRKDKTAVLGSYGRSRWQN